MTFRTALPLFAGLCACLVFVPVSQADPLPSQADAQAAIQGVFDNQDASAARMYLPGITHGLAADYAGIDTHNTVTHLADLQASVRQLFGNVQSGTYSTQVESVALVGAGAVVTAKRHHMMVLVDPVTMVLTNVVSDAEYRSYWIFQGGQWLERRNRTLSRYVRVNGAPAKAV